MNEKNAMVLLLWLLLCVPTSGDALSSGDTLGRRNLDGAPDPNACTLPCKNSGTCRITTQGDKDKNSTMFCDCASENGDGNGFHGDLCQFKATPCGDEGQCMHGSTCVEPRDPNDAINKHHFCDCTAQKRGVGVGYAGRYCQYKATSYCASNHNGLIFCVNNGKCHEDGDVGSGVFSCVCPDGFHGPSCEFQDKPGTNTTKDDQKDGEGNVGYKDEKKGSEENDANDKYRGDDYEVCTMQCRNGGACRKGIKDNSAASGYSEILSQHGGDTSSIPFTPSSAIDHEHCVCPRGYFGDYCETQVEECRSEGFEGNADKNDNGNKNSSSIIEHFCLHGSKCKRREAGSWTCDCEHAFTESESWTSDGRKSKHKRKKYSGKFCQHHHTDICHPTSSTASSIYKGPSTSLSFCVNDGVCIEVVEDGESFPGCKCPDGYTGQHCELLERVHIPGVDGDQSDTVGSTAAIPLVLTVLSTVLVVLVVATMMRYREYQQKKRNIELSHMQHAAERRRRKPYRDRVGGKLFRDDDDVNSDDAGDAASDSDSFSDSMDLEEIDLL